jgi:hypothetical protein
MGVAGCWEDSAEVVGRGEVDRVVETWIDGDASLKPISAATNDLAEELDLQPALAGLNRLGRRNRSRKLGYPDEVYRRDQIDQTLRDPH